MEPLTAGISVLNGHPFTRYCIDSLYPHVDRIVIGDGAVGEGAHLADETGASTDGTRELLIELCSAGDPDGKLRLVTNSRPWPTRDDKWNAILGSALEGFFWQVDSDEFYTEQQMKAVRDLLEEDPTISGASVWWKCFWGSRPHLVDTWELRRGAAKARRIFRYRRGYVYGGVEYGPSIRPEGERTDSGRWVSADEMLARGVFMYHYSLVFPAQVREKCSIYATRSDIRVGQPKAVEWAEQNWFRIGNPFRVHNRYLSPSWLEEFRGSHPAAAERMFEDIRAGRIDVETRGSRDVDSLMKSVTFRARRAVLRTLSHLDKRWHHTKAGYWLGRCVGVWIDYGERVLLRAIVWKVTRGCLRRVGLLRKATAANG